MKIRISNEELNYMQLFELVTDVDCLDCYWDKETDTIFFVVPEGMAKRAIGKEGWIVNVLRNKLGKNVRIIEHSSNLEKFVRNMISYVKNIEEKSIDGGKVIYINVEKFARPRVLGRNRRNEVIYKRILGRHFNIKDIIIK